MWSERNRGVTARDVPLVPEDKASVGFRYKIIFDELKHSTETILAANSALVARIEKLEKGK